MLPIEALVGPSVMLLTGLIAAWFVGFWIAKRISRRRTGPSGAGLRLNVEAKLKVGMVATGLCLASTFVIQAVLAAIGRILDIPGFGIGAATFFGPPPWWIATSCLLTAAIQVVVATLSWLFALDRLVRKG